MSLTKYDPNNVTAICGASIMGGWGDGTFIEVERDEDAFLKKTGVDGEVARAKNNNKGGKITLTLMQTSPSHAKLEAFRLIDENTGLGSFTFVLRDSNGSTLVTATDSWVKKAPKLVYAKEVQAWQWTIDVGTMILSVGA